MDVAALLPMLLLLLGGLIVLRIAGRGRRGEIAVADLAVVLAAVEIAALIRDVDEVRIALGIDSAAVLPVIVLVGCVLVVASSFARWIAFVVTALGAVAAVVATWISDGAVAAVGLFGAILLLWMISRMVRVVIG